jgi:uncharacterized protein (TIGR02145 family)
MKNSKSKIHFFRQTNIFILILLTFLFYSCNKNKNTKPSIETISFTELTSQSVIIEGKVNNPDNFNIFWQGVAWGTTSNPEFNTFYTTFENVSSTTFNSKIYNLLPNTTYYFRTYLNLDGQSNIVYGKEISITTPPSEISQFNINKTYGSNSDVDGNIYKTIQIGNQTWMAENLRVSKFNNGSAINEVTVNNSFYNNGNPAWCYYKDSIQYNNLYGKLYNEFVVTNNNNVCPTGWHVPTINDFQTLKDNLPSINSGGVLKSTGYNFWNSPNEGATNETGFSAVGSGIRNDFDNYYGIKAATYFWLQDNCYFGMVYTSPGGPSYGAIETMVYGSNYPGQGCSIRCVKD